MFLSPGSRARPLPQWISFKRQQVLTPAQQVQAKNNLAAASLQGYLFGLTMSTAGGSGTMSFSAGAAADSTGANLMPIAAFTKTTSAWAVGSGNGGLDTGTIANSTWYHFFLIARPPGTGGTVDIVFSATSTPASGPSAMPAGYTFFRRIGSMLTDGSAHWTAFYQNGDQFVWQVPTLDVTSGTLGTSASLFTLTVPLGIVVAGQINGWAENAALSYILISSTNVADEAPSSSLFSALLTAGVDTQCGQFSVLTNTSAQIRLRSTNTTTTVVMPTVGWIDTRGKLN